MSQPDEGARLNNAPGPGPLVSIVIPAYNAAATIRETIASVLNQTLTDFEIIVVDDGSIDDTRELVTGIRDPRIRLFSYSNAGPAATRNRGIAQAAGEMVAFLDSDDLWAPGKLANQVRALRRHPGAALAYGWTDYIDEDGRFLKHGGRLEVGEGAYEQLITGNFLENGSTPLVRYSALLEVGVFDEAIWGTEDWDLWLRLAYCYPFVCVPEVQVFYRVRPGSISSQTERQIKSCLTILDRAIARLPRTPARERLERTARAELYRTLVARLVETSASRREGRRAANFWWHYVKSVPAEDLDLGKNLLLVCAILAIVILPPTMLAKLRKRAIALRHRGERQQDSGGPPPPRQDISH